MLGRIRTNGSLTKGLSVLLLLILALGAKGALSGYYTVNQKAPASATNYKSFTALFKDLDSGVRTDSFSANGKGVSGAVIVTVISGSGPYNEQASLREVNGTSASNTITIKGNNERIEFSTSSSAIYVLSFNGVDYMTIDSLTISASGNAYGRCVEVRNQSDYVTIVNCRLTMPNLTGTSDYNGYVMITNGTANPRVYTDPGKYCRIIRNKMTAAINSGPYFGILISNPANGTIWTGYEISDNDIQDVYTYYIYAFYTVGTKIRNNQLHNDGHNRQGYLYGIYLYNYQTRCDAEITGNMLYNFNTGSTGMYDGRFSIYVYMNSAPNTQKLLLANNIIDIQCTYYTPGVYVYGYGASNTGVDFFYNTLYYGGRKVNTYTFGLYLSQMYYVDLDVRNNIFFCDWDVSGSIYGFYFYSGSIKFENNIISLNGVTGTGPVYYGYDGFNGHTSLNDWEKAINGKSNLNSDPALADPMNKNWRPTSFEIVNKGTPVSVSNDIFMNTRSSSVPDIGAIEYFLDVALSGFQISATNVCGNYSENVKITIRNQNSYAVQNIPMAFEINKGNKITETIRNVIQSGDSLQFIFGQKARFNDPGKNLIRVYLNGTDDDLKNNEMRDSLSITSSPYGGLLSEGNVFPGYFRQGISGGTMSDPDITIPGMEITYEITNPLGYTNPGYGVNWTMSGVFFTSGGAVISNGVSYVAPFGSSKGQVKFKPAADFSDSMIFIGVRVKSLITGCDSIFGRYVYVPDVPNVNFSFADVCDGEVVEFKNSTTLKKGSIFYKWRFNDPNRLDDTSELIDPVYKYDNYGNYDVELEANLVLYPKFRFSNSKKINITAVPNIDFKVFNACEGEPIVFKDYTIFPAGGGSNAIYNWRFGDGSANAYNQDPSHIYAQAGAYKVTLTVSLNGCGAAITKNVNQFARPVASFDKSGDCHREGIRFINKTKISQGNSGNKWSFGDGDISNLQNPTHFFESPGSKRVKLLAISEFGCTDSSELSFMLNESPVADFNFSDPCSMTPVNFIMNGTIPAGNTPVFKWNFDGQDSSVQENPKHLFNGEGLKMVTLEIRTTNGCSDMISKAVLVKRQAKAAFEALDACEGEEVTFTNKSLVDEGILHYEWRFGDANISNKTSPTHKYAVSGNSRTYQVTLVANVPDGCSDSVTRPVTVFAKSDARFSDSVSGRFVLFTPYTQDPTFSYNWRFGEGSSSTDMKPLHIYQNIDQGMFEACLGIINNAGCLSEACKMVRIDLLGMNEQPAKGLRLFPNPANQVLNIEFRESFESAVLEVYDVLGKGVYRSTALKTIDVSAFEQGLYLLKVINGNGTHILKFSVVR